MSLSRDRTHPFWREAWPRVIAMMLLMVVLGYWCVRNFRQSGRTLRNDWGIYYLAGQHAGDAEPIYIDGGGDDYLYTLKGSPMVAALCVPMSQLNPVIARVLWTLADAVMIVLTVWLVLRLLLPMPPPWRSLGASPAQVWPALMAIALTALPISQQFQAGQTSCWWVMPTVLAFTCLVRGWPIAAGALLAFGVLVKLLPIALLPYALVAAAGHRRPVSFVLMVFASFAISIALLLIVLPAMMVSWPWAIEQARLWPQHLLVTEVPDQVWRVQNGGVYALIGRFTMDDNYTPLQIVSLDQGVVRAIWLGVSVLGAIALYLWLWMNRRVAPAGWRWAVHLSLILMFITCFNPHAWRYNFVTTLVPIAVIVASLFLLPGRGVWGRASLLGAGVLLNAMPMGSNEWGTIDWPQALGARMWGAVALAVGCLLVWRLARQHDALHHQPEIPSP